MTRTAVLSPSVVVPVEGAEECPGSGARQRVVQALLTYQEAVHRGVAERLGVRVDHVEVALAGDGAHGVRLEVRLTGPDSPEAYDRVRALVETRGPVLDLVTGRPGARH